MQHGESISSHALVKLLAMHCVLENRPLTICRRIFVRQPGDNPICVWLKGKLGVSTGGVKLLGWQSLVQCAAIQNSETFKENTM
eukprot:scaffold92943_cov72-Cyclotella_meneghiniana.AAC.5